MFISYEKIGETLKLFYPKYSREINKFCYEKKIERNCTYIKNNAKKVSSKLQKEYKKRPLKVLFHVYEPCRWKSQTIYDLMAKDEHFDPIIIVTKNNAGKNNPNYQTKEDVIKTYNFFKERNMKVKLGYDIEEEKFIPFEKFNPDIIFYTHPYFVQTQQGPVVCSKFALTYYIPYFVANTPSSIDYDLRFHQYIHRHYVLNEEIKKEYHNGQERKANNFVAVGHPLLDYFYLNKDVIKNKKYVIYSPHWSICGVSQYFSTFEWTGKFILEFAKKHPKINWIFKPHPLLEQQIVRSKLMSIEERDQYYNDWKKLGLYCDDGNYLNLFDESYAMITDCGSFLTEYFMTENPVIHLVSPYAWEYNNNVKKIVSSYYQAHDLQELEQYLHEVLIEKNDIKKQERLDLLEKLKLKDNYCAERILNDIKEELNG